MLDVSYAPRGSVCVSTCRSNPSCQWFTYNSLDKACILLRDCPTISECDSCLSGQTQCSEREGKKAKLH